LATKEINKAITIEVEAESIKKPKIERPIMSESTMSSESSNNGPKLE